MGPMLISGIGMRTRLESKESCVSMKLDVSSQEVAGEAPQRCLCMRGPDHEGECALGISNGVQKCLCGRVLESTLRCGG